VINHWNLGNMLDGELMCTEGPTVHLRQVPSAIVTDHHQPHVKAIQQTVPTAVHIGADSTG
jgi:hypothetical protein